MKLIYSVAITCVLIASCATTVFSQVTIGSGNAPQSGALLDLKQNSDGTSGMGLNLPRVKLIEWNATDNDLRTTIHGAGTDGPSWDAKAHIGLLVYNLNNDSRVCVGERYYIPPTSGLYVWTGDEWDPLYKTEDLFPDVRNYFDHGTRAVDGITVGSFTMSYNDGVNPAENETYYYADYGEAGIWMTQNLRTRYTPQGELIQMTGRQSDNGLDGSGKPQKVAGYPAGSGPATSATYYNSNRSAGKEVGLLYDWYTMTNHENCKTSNQGQVGYLSANPAAPGANEIENIEDRGYIQGICPKGWGLPTDRDWNRLEKYMTQNASLLTQATVTANGTWNNTWELATQAWRGTVAGKAMKSKSSVYNSSYTLSNANSKTAQNGGFDAYITGYAYDGEVGDYGYYGYFWTASGYSSTTAWARNIGYSDSGVFRGEQGTRAAMFSVRCIKKD